jgi:hypothetical protein
MYELEVRRQAGHRDITRVVGKVKFIAFSRNQQTIFLTIAIQDTE